MTIKQLSIFIENRQGALLEVLRLFRDHGISIIVSTLADTDGFGIYRVICTDAQKAFDVLSQRHINVALSSVYALRLADNRAGAAADLMAYITEGGVEVKYMYSFLYGGKGIIVFRTDDTDRADGVILLHKLDYLTEEDLKE